MGEAKRLEIDQMKYLFSLRLKFDGEEEGRRKNEDDQHQLVLETLQPPLTLKELEIWSHRGNTVSASSPLFSFYYILFSYYLLFIFWFTLLILFTFLKF